MPRVIIIARPNGAGKTTFARTFLPNEARTLPFVNADLIALGLSPFDSSLADVAAGKIMLQRLDALSYEGVDFALETTLSGIWLKPRILDWQQKGYIVHLHFLRLSTAEMAVERVQNRVAHGGHNIPKNVIHRRFTRSLRLLESTYKNLVDDWFVYDSSGPEAILLESKWMH